MLAAYDSAHATLCAHMLVQTDRQAIVCSEVGQLQVQSTPLLGAWAISREGHFVLNTLYTGA